MTCQYCGRDNPDGATYCECGRPLSLGGTNTGASANSSAPKPESPFAYQTLDSVKRTRNFPVVPVIVILAALLGVGIFFGLRWLDARHMTDPSSWKEVSEPLFTITVPPALEKGEMLTLQGSRSEHLVFYTSRLGGFNVGIYRYSDAEKELYGNLDAKAFTAAQQMIKLTLNGQEVKYQVREGQNYAFLEYSRHAPNYVGKSDEVWFIEALFPTPKGYYIVDVYCAEEDKGEYRDYLLQWLDNFTSKI